MTKIMLALAAVLCAGAGVASAQTAAAPRGFVVVNGGYQLTINDFSDSAVKRENAEDGRWNTKYVVNGGVAIDVAAGAIVWRRLGVGVGVSRFSVATPASLRATVPHPFFFNQPRSVNGEATRLKREEMVIHVQVRGVLPVGDRLQVMVFGGPSFFQITQGVITDFSYTDSYPYDTATFSASTTTNASVSKLGFHVGGDVAFFFTKQVGIGATVQFAGTSVVLPAAGGATQSVKVGGTRLAEDCAYDSDDVPPDTPDDSIEAIRFGTPEGDETGCYLEHEKECIIDPQRIGRVTYEEITTPITTAALP